MDIVTAPLPPDRLAARREHLMTELMTRTTDAVPAAPSRRRAPRRLVATAAGVAAMAVAVAVATSVTNSPAGHSGVAFAIERTVQGTVSVHVVDSEVSAKAMTRQLHAAGVDVSVSTMPATPQLVGTWVAETFSGDVPTAVQDAIIEQTAGYVATLELPAQLPGKVELIVGRAPHRGEQAVVHGRRNALAPGGRLHCLRLVGTTATAAQARLATAGYSVRWADGNRDSLAPLAAPLAGRLVAEAFVNDTAPRDVQVVLTSPASPRFGAQAWKGFTPSQRAAGRPGYDGCPAA